MAKIKDNTVGIYFVPPQDRHVLDINDPDTPLPYGNRLVELALVAATESSSKDKVTTYYNILTSVMEAILKTHEHIWIGVQGVCIQAIGIKPFVQTGLKENNDTIIITGKDYRGKAIFKYDSGTSDIKSVEQNVVSIVCNIKDIDYIQLPKVSDDLKDIVDKIMIGDTTRITKMINIMSEKYNELNTLVYNCRYRSYFNEFNDFVSQYPNDDDTKEKLLGCPEAVNLYDEIWKKYRETILNLFPTKFEDSKIIPISEDTLASIEIEGVTEERMFTVSEMNLMLTAVGMDTISPTSVKTE